MRGGRDAGCAGHGIESLAPPGAHVGSPTVAQSPVLDLAWRVIRGNYGTRKVWRRACLRVVSRRHDLVLSARGDVMVR